MPTEHAETGGRVARVVRRVRRLLAPGEARPAGPGAPARDAPGESARFRAILTGMSDGVMMLDAELCLLEWNPRFSEFTGVPPAMLRVGLPMEDILRVQASAGEFGEVDVETEVARRMALLRAGGASGTIERTRPNGTTMELRRNPLPGGGFVTLYTDITARRRAEEQFRQAQKMETVGHLTGGVAHDFNNLLMIILGNLERSERALREGDAATARRGIEVARGGARRAALLSQRLLAFSRRRPREARPVGPNTVIAEMTDLIRQSVPRNVSVLVELAEAEWCALIDPNQFEIALLNLVVNARDAMPRGGAVTVSTANVVHAVVDPSAGAGVTAVPQECVLVTVRDTGTGMTPEVVARAAEPFFTTKPPGKGTGLGLYQVVDFVRLSGGQVQIDSEPGVGTAVRLYLPRLADARPEAAMPPTAEAARPGRGEAVLVVEDEPDILAYVTEGLEAMGFRAHGAQDASAALTALESFPDIRLVFTDIGLPGIGGRQLAQEAVRRRPELLVLHTSGGSETALPAEARAADYLAKPYDLASLARLIRQRLDHPAGVDG